MCIKAHYQESENTNYRMEKKILVNHIADKGLVSRIYKKFSQLNNKMTKNQVKKWTNDLNGHVSKVVQWPRRI